MSKRHRASGHTAVMQDRASAAVIDEIEDPVTRLHMALEFFPTPPWATRALMKYVIPDAGGTAWDPCCGEGHMAEVLEEYFDAVYASDVHDHGCGAVGSFVGAGLDVIPSPPVAPHWLICNPPFSLALDFTKRALDEATDGVAVLVRLAWLETQTRFDELFRRTPPSIVAQFVERVPMTLGRWEPDAGTATPYAWCVWHADDVARGDSDTRFRWIPPGQRRALTRPDDAARFAKPARGDDQPMLFELF